MTDRSRNWLWNLGIDFGGAQAAGQNVDRKLTAAMEAIARNFKD
jgi:hypothetical protein